jgi:DNA-binding response OmpR family regulator
VRVLLVEDDAETAQIVQETLEAARLNVDRVDCLTDARQMLASRTYDCVVLDLGLPDGSGLELADSLRSTSEVPILMLTAQAALQQRLDGFAHGADDYVCKPCMPDELVARIQALLRRARPERQHVLRYADLQLDLLRRTVTRGGAETPLSDREAALLAYLIRHAGQPVAREALGQDVWGLGPADDAGVVNVYINYLRNKLEHGNQAARLIHTVRGIGYIFSETPPSGSPPNSA